MEVREISLAPLCRACKVRHWGMCPRNNEVTTADIVTEIRAKIPKKVVTTAKIVTKGAEKVVTTVTTPEDIRKAKQREKSAKWREANRERYNGYMREQRAKKRAAKAEYIKTHLEMMEG